MSISSGKQISLDVDAILANLQRIDGVLSGSGGSTLPEPDQVSPQFASMETPVVNFNSGLTWYSEGMARRLRALRANLLDLHKAIEDTAQQFVDNDAELEHIATQLTGRIDTGPVPGAEMTVDHASAVRVQPIANVNKISKMMDW